MGRQIVNIFVLALALVTLISDVKSQENSVKSSHEDFTVKNHEISEIENQETLRGKYQEIVANVGQFPFVVSLRNKNDEHYCSGSIINDRWILSSMDCDQTDHVGNIAKVWSISVNSTGDTYKILQSSNHMHGVLLLKTETSIIFNENVRAIQLETDFIEEDTPAVSTRFISQDKLVWSKTSTLNQYACEFLWMNLNEKIPENQFCTNQFQYCEAEKGSALISRGKIIGITKWNQFSCSRFIPQTYLRIDKTYDWIKQVTEG